MGLTGFNLARLKEQEAASAASLCPMPQPEATTPEVVTTTPEVVTTTPVDKPKRKRRAAPTPEVTDGEG